MSAEKNKTTKPFLIVEFLNKNIELYTYDKAMLATFSFQNLKIEEYLRIPIVEIAPWLGSEIHRSEIILRRPS